MARLTTIHPVASLSDACTTLDRLDTERNDWLLRERADDRGFVCDIGPFTSYRRTVVETDHGIVETTEFTVAAAIWRPLFTPVAKRYLRRPPRPTAPWWAPPDRLDAAAATTLSLLTIATLTAAYLGTLLSQTITFVADDFGADRSTQGLVTGLTRIGALLALAVVAAADRIGRRTMLLAAGTGSAVFAAATALTPGIWWFGSAQTLSRGLATGFGILIGVAAAEEAPDSSRAWVTSVLALCAGLGSGMVLWLIPFADRADSAWRVLYVVALLALPTLWFLRGRLRETRRFMQRVVGASVPITSSMRRRFAMLATVGAAASMFAAPASNFQNEYLRDERGFSGGRIGLYSTAVSTPVGIGVAVAGRFADRRSRRVIGAIGLFGGVVFAVVRYNAAGPLMWCAGVLSTVIGAATIPALGVYGPELFPTSRRGLANGLLTCVSVIGSVIGLWFVGEYSERWGFGRTFAWLAIVPILAILVISRYPETGGRSLEDLNPEDHVGP